MPLLMLPRTWPGNFRRTIDGVVLEFSPAKATEVSDADYAALIENGDVGTALYPATVDEKGRARVDQETFDTIVSSRGDEADQDARPKSAKRKRSKPSETPSDSSPNGQPGGDGNENSESNGEGENAPAGDEDPEAVAAAAAESAGADAPPAPAKPKRSRKR
jgi:hypothetical protein